jgi:hypothetical protein
VSELLPGVADRLHARLHDAFLQLGGDVGEPLQGDLELGVLVAAGDLQQLVAGEHQFGDHGHQMFQRVHVDADRLVGDLVGAIAVAFGRDDRAFGRFLRGFGFGGLCGRNDGRSFRCGLAEGALEFVKRHFTGAQRALQGLLDQRALGDLGFDGGCRRNRR